MTVRLLGLNCSPRDNSNSGIMLETAFEKLDATYPGEAEHEVIHLRDLHIEPCKACNVCGKTEGRHASSPACASTRTTCRRSSTRWWPPTASSWPRPSTSGCPPTSSPSSSCARAPLRHQDFKLANRPVGVHGHRRPPLRRRRDGDHRHVAALRAQRLPRRRQRRRHLPVRRLRLGRRPRPHPQRRVGPGAGLPDRASACSRWPG